MHFVSFTFLLPSVPNGLFGLWHYGCVLSGIWAGLCHIFLSDKWKWKIKPYSQSLLSTLAQSHLSLGSSSPAVLKRGAIGNHSSQGRLPTLILWFTQDSRSHLPHPKGTDKSYLMATETLKLVKREHVNMSLLWRRPLPWKKVLLMSEEESGWYEWCSVWNGFVEWMNVGLMSLYRGKDEVC